MPSLSLCLAAALVCLHVLHADDTQCGGDGIDDSERSAFLNLHNDARLKMAKGLSPNLSSGKNVYKLSWDCNLESQARDYIQDCPSDLPSTSGIGVNLEQWTGEFTDPMTDATDILNSWWAASESTPLTPPDNRYPGEDLYQFSNMANGKATAIGCAYSVCEGGDPQILTVACYYNLIGYYTNGIVYEKGPACTTNSACTTYPSSTCLGGLCSKSGSTGPGPVVTQAPVPVTQAPTGTSGSAPSCASTQLTNEARKTFLDLHNQYRSSVVRGLEKDALGGYAPRGSRMLKLKYDCTIEASAQAVANRCVFGHSDSSYGENLWMSTGRNMDKVAAATSAVTGWWSELSQYGVGQSNMLTTALWNRPKPSQIGHYTQMAWADTGRIGCAIANCPTMTLGVCQYGPAGNFMNSLIYPLGTPCSACAAGQSCNPAEGLCVAP